MKSVDIAFILIGANYILQQKDYRSEFPVFSALDINQPKYLMFVNENQTVVTSSRVILTFSVTHLLLYTYNHDKPFNEAKDAIFQIKVVKSDLIKRWRFALEVIKRSDFFYIV